MIDPNLVVKIIEILIAGGVGVGIKNVWDLYVRRSEAKTPAAKQAVHIGLVEKSLVSVSASRDALEKDITRLREAREREQDAAERREEWWLKREADWHCRLEALEAEIDQLRSALSGTLRELDRLRLEVRHEIESREPRD